MRYNPLSKAMITNKGNMLFPTIFMALAAAVLLYAGYRKGVHVKGLVWGLTMTLKILPLVFLALLVAGMVQLLIPRESISAWIGSGAGLRGIILGSIAGSLSPGGPYVSLPIALALLHSGASIGTVVSFLTAWSLMAVSRLPMEIGFLGWKVTVIRVMSTFFFPPVAGLIAQTLFGSRTGG